MSRIKIFSKIYLQVVLFALVVFFLHPNLGSSQTIQLNSRDLFHYAEYLLEKREYYRAISEYKRIIFYFPYSIYAKKAKIQIGHAYVAGGELSEGINYLNGVLRKLNQKDPAYFEVSGLLGISWLDLDQKRAFTYRKRNVEKGIRYLEKVSQLQNNSKHLKHFIEDWREGPITEEKDPWIAGLMSALIPGAGSFYTGRYKEGVYTFFITGLFLWATMDAVHSENRELSYLFGFFTLAFYGGGIYTAVNSVHIYNDQTYTRYLRKLRNKYGLWYIPQGERFPTLR